MPLSQTLNLLNKDRKATESREIDEIMGVLRDASKYTRQYRAKEQTKKLADDAYMKENKARIDKEILKYNPKAVLPDTTNGYRNADKVIVSHQAGELLKTVKGEEALNTRIDNSAMNGNIPYDKAQKMKSLPYTERTEAYIRLTGNRAQEARQNKTLQFDSVSTGNELTQQFKDYLKSIGKNDAYITRISELNNKRLTGTLNDKEIAELGSAKGYIDSLDSLNANAVKPTTKTKLTAAEKNMIGAVGINLKLKERIESATNQTFDAKNLTNEMYTAIKREVGEHKAKVSVYNGAIQKAKVSIIKGNSVLRLSINDTNGKEELVVNGVLWDGEDIPSDATVGLAKKTFGGKYKKTSAGKHEIKPLKPQEDSIVTQAYNTLMIHTESIKGFNEEIKAIDTEYGLIPSDATGVDATDAKGYGEQIDPDANAKQDVQFNLKKAMAEFE